MITYGIAAAIEEVNREGRASYKAIGGESGMSLLIDSDDSCRRINDYATIGTVYDIELHGICACCSIDMDRI